MHRFPYKWHLKDGYPAKGIKENKFNVFGTFICGGGSTMGYKLAGYNHLGGVEIDERIVKVYKKNHNPKYLFHMDIRTFNEKDDLPDELFNLDLLDGSPPCSTFSTSGSREKAWNKKKKFKEGQTEQTLDDLVFIYLDTIEKLKPKVALFENVKGLAMGNAKGYLKEVYRRFTASGYAVQVFILNAAKMGVPQARERVFVIGLRNDFNLPKLKLNFNEKPILFKEVSEGLLPEDQIIRLTAKNRSMWIKCKPGKSFGTVHPRGSFFNHRRLDMNRVSVTLLADLKFKIYHPVQCRCLSLKEWLQIGSYPMDYDFGDHDPFFLIGMSVPPVMTAQIANQINIQWLSKING